MIVQMVFQKNDLLNYSYSVYRFRNISRPIFAEKIDPSTSARIDLILHCHDFPQIWYCINGSFSITVNGITYTMTPGSLLPVPPGALHTNSIPEGSSFEAFRTNINYNIFMDEDPEKYLNSKIHLFMGSFRSELRLDELAPIVLPEEIRNEAEEIFSRLCCPELPSINLSAEELPAELEALFSLQGLDFPQKTKKRATMLWDSKIAPIISAISYVNKNFNEKILIEDMLKLTFLGHSTFFETFRKFINCSFATYLQVIRLKNAHSMMAGTSFPIAQVAFMCGFSSHSHMERAYKKFSGVSSSRARAHSKEWAREYAKKKNNDMQKPQP